MKKCLVSIICTLCAGAAFAAGENVATSKAFVDNAVAQKQEKIPANDGAAQVLTNTGTPGAVGTKNIYDSTGTYSEQTDSLITAGDFNTAVQNAIDAEFECVAWRDPNDHSSDCMLVNIKPRTTNLLNTPAAVRNATFDTATATMSNTWTTDKNFLRLFAWYSSVTDYSDASFVIQRVFYEGQTYKTTFTTGANTRYLYVKHNDNPSDIGLWFDIEPSTTYTLIVKALETNLSVVGGMKLQLMLVRGNYEYDDILPYGENVYMPRGN